jgi:adenylate cyclase
MDGELRRAGIAAKLGASMRRMIHRLAMWLGIVAGSWLVALGAENLPVVRNVVSRGDDTFYDAFYRLRPFEDQTDGPVVIIAVDDKSLKDVDDKRGFGWPWPRDFWGYLAKYLDQSGAKAIGIDLIFDQTSVYENSTGDDDTLGSTVQPLKTPIIFGSMVNADGSWDKFAPKVVNPVFGAVNVGNDVVYRWYTPKVDGEPSLALATVKAAGEEAKLPVDSPFRLHYYGPNQTADGHTTFRYVSAAAALGAAAPDAKPGTSGVSPDWFKGKIVLIGAISAGTYDLKSSPLSAQFPGVEIQATAIGNLLNGQEVTDVPEAWHAIAALAGAAVAAGLVIFPRPAGWKILGPVLAILGILGFGAELFVGPNIRWMSPTGPLIAVAVATVAAFAWTYFAEDRQRRFMLKALSKVVSPAVAEQLSREPHRLALGTVRAQVTLLFTDLANFTGMSEMMDVQKLGELLNRYLGEMSDEVLKEQGTLDKYIGDAIMCFWNAPLPQRDHAARACRAALAIAKREEAIREELKGLGAAALFTRIGINTTDAAVGFVGSSHLFNYTALGDGVNLASRLEGANKLYGTRILISQTTADLAGDQFVLRRVDLLQVKGKRQPMAVYELLAEQSAAGSEKLRDLANRYEAAWSQYQMRNWDQAEKELLEVLSRFGEDAASRKLLDRIAYLRAHPPAEDWDGVYEAKEK